MNRTRFQEEGPTRADHMRSARRVLLSAVTDPDLSPVERLGRVRYAGLRVWMAVRGDRSLG